MKSKIFLFLVLALFGLHGRAQVSVNNNSNEDTIPSSWKTYNNNNLGITFQYPESWSKYGEESNVINRTGVKIGIKINFIDTLSQTTLLIDFNLAPNGIELYNYAVSQYESSLGLYASGGKYIEVAGNKAIQAFTTMSIDGKGNIIHPTFRLIIVDFLDKRHTGLFELQFRTPLPDDDIEVAKFKQLLSTFKFTNL